MQGLKNKKISSNKSLLKDKIRQIKDIEEVYYTHEKFKVSRKKLFEILKDHKKYIFGAAIAAAFNGAVWPIYGILLADAIGTLSENDKDLVRKGGTMVSIYFVCLALAAAMILWMQK